MAKRVRVFYIEYTSHDGQACRMEFSLRPNAVAWLNKLILDYGYFDAKLKPAYKVAK